MLVWGFGQLKIYFNYLVNFVFIFIFLSYERFVIFALIFIIFIIFNALLLLLMSSISLHEYTNLTIHSSIEKQPVGFQFLKIIMCTHLHAGLAMDVSFKIIF